MEPTATAVAADPATVNRKGDDTASEAEVDEEDAGRYTPHTSVSALIPTRVLAIIERLTILEMADWDVRESEAYRCSPGYGIAHPYDRGPIAQS